MCSPAHSLCIRPSRSAWLVTDHFLSHIVRDCDDTAAMISFNRVLTQFQDFPRVTWMMNATGARTGGGPSGTRPQQHGCKHLALSDATLDSYPQIVDAARSFVKVQRLGRES